MDHGIAPSPAPPSPGQSPWPRGFATGRPRALDRALSAASGTSAAASVPAVAAAEEAQQAAAEEPAAADETPGMRRAPSGGDADTGRDVDLRWLGRHERCWYWTSCTAGQGCRGQVAASGLRQHLQGIPIPLDATYRYILLQTRRRAARTRRTPRRRGRCGGTTRCRRRWAGCRCRRCAPAAAATR